MTVTSTTEISTAWAYRDKVTSTQSNCYSKPFLGTQYVLKHTPEDREAERESTGYERREKREREQREKREIERAIESIGGRERERAIEREIEMRYEKIDSIYIEMRQRYHEYRSRSLLLYLALYLPPLS